MNLDDPRLTAYALGELPAAELAAVEAAIQADPALAAEVAAIRALGGRLGGALAREAAPATGLGPARRAVIDQAARPRRAIPFGPLAAAAAIILATSGAFLLVRPAPAMQGDLRPVARAEQAPPVGRTLPAPAPASTAQPDLSPLQPSQTPLKEAEAPALQLKGREESVTDAEMGGLGRFMGVGAGAPDKSAAGGSWAAPSRAPAEITRDGASAWKRADSASPSAPASPTPAAGPSSATKRGLTAATPACPPPPPGGGAWRGGEADARMAAQAFTRVLATGGDVSTFGVDVDTASYGLIRDGILQRRQLPAVQDVRIEELVNAQRYRYAGPPVDGDEAFAVHAQIAACPWQPAHRLARVALKGKEVSAAGRPGCNLVFLIDVSGSMSPAERLPLIQRAFQRLVAELDARDRIAIVTYAGSSGVVLASTPGDRHDLIQGAVARLSANGSTNGAAGIRDAYEQARRGFIPGGANRVILATDGDFNVGISDKARLVDMVKQEAASGVHLTVLGVGRDNLRNEQLRAMADNGDGQYHWLADETAAARVFGHDLAGSLITIAKDVKIQVFFNPARVAAWRLLGYEKRQLAAQDFNDDAKDAGDIGAGHSVTALYELIPAGSAVPGDVDANPFRREAPAAAPAEVLPNDALLRLRLRAQPPQGGTSRLQEFDLVDPGRDWREADADWRLAAAAAGFGLRLRHEAGAPTWALLRALAREAAGSEPERCAFADLVDAAASLGSYRDDEAPSPLPAGPWRGGGDLKPR